MTNELTPMKIYSCISRKVRFVAITTAACCGIGAATALAQPGPYYPSGPVYYQPAPYYQSAPYFTHQANGLGFYLGGELGLNVMQSFNSQRFGFPGRFDADPGTRFTVSPGFDFVSSRPVTIGVEFETGVLYNHIYSIVNAGVPTSFRGDYYQVPFLGNVVFKFHPDPFITPYLGIGGGGVYSSLQTYSYGNYWNGPTSDETDPAVQAKAGVRFRLNPFLEVGIGYTFLGVIPGGNRFVGNHSVVASASFDF
jgi:hypothetical protein